MIWKSGLSVLTRVICVIGVLLSFSGHNAHAASTPVTAEDDLGGLLTLFPSLPVTIIDEVRNTCDPDFWDVLKDRAWAEGQREITQNNNLIARPDSVLSLTCFDSFMDHLTDYAEHEFPGNPDKSVGYMGGGMLGAALSSLSGVFTDLIIFDLAELFYAAGDGLILPAPPFKRHGYLMYAVLELLVFDQLMDNVPSPNASSIMRAGDVIEDPLLAACVGYMAAIGEPIDEFKKYYIEENFPNSFLGGRSTLSASLDDDADDNPYICNRMNQIWAAAKCYNMVTETGHDGFYPLSKYRDHAGAGNDYRSKDEQCDIPSDTNNIMQYLPDVSDGNEVLRYACQVAEHGYPQGVASLSALQALFVALIPTDLPTWDSAYLGANPAPGTSGAMDSYMNFLGLRDSTSCSSITPIKVGYIVVADNGDRYIDAVCPAPGCYFNPPSNVTDDGNCN